MIHVSLQASVPREEMLGEPQRRVDQLQAILADDVGEPVVFELTMVPTETIEVRSGPQP